MTIIGAIKQMSPGADTDGYLSQNAEQGARHFVVAGNEIFGLRLKVREQFCLVI
jgi:hypothetical protein